MQAVRWRQKGHHLPRYAAQPPTPHPTPLVCCISVAGDPVYLVCNELGGDSSLVALSPLNGTTAWATSASAVSSPPALTSVTAAVAAEGMLVYAAEGTNLTALGADDGGLLWQVAVGAAPGMQPGAAVTHLALAGDVLLVR